MSKSTNILELHYWLDNDLHSMNAVVQNKCEAELLSIINEIATIFESEVVIETEPLGEGGIRRWFKLVSKNEKKNLSISVTVISTFAVTVLFTPIATAISKSVEIMIENVLEDDIEKESKELDNEEKKLKIEKLKLEILEKKKQIESSYKIQKRKSNFYEELEKEKKVNKVSFLIEDENRKPKLEEFHIVRNDFKNYILVSDKLEPITIENAVIEIITPVLKKGNYKWRGFYNDDVVSFNMKSNEFKTLVQTGKIEFKNGSSIDCVLEIENELDNEGNKKITAYNILRVNNYFDNDKPIETPEGKLHRQKLEADENQFKMDI
jgi:hypothetical protein